MLKIFSYHMVSDLFAFYPHGLKLSLKFQTARNKNKKKIKNKKQRNIINIVILPKEKKTFYKSLVYKFKRIVGKPNLSDQFKR